MYILGIHQSHNATAVLLKNGIIIAAVSEERFTRNKNQFGIPFQSIKYCLDTAGITPEDVDKIVIPGSSWPNFISSLETSGRQHTTQYKFLYFLRAITNQFYSVLLYIGYKFPILKMLSQAYQKLFYRIISIIFYPQIIQLLIEKFGFKKEKIIIIDHHLAHAYSAVFASPFISTKNSVLVFTCDGEGDGLCATISMLQNNTLVRKVAISEANSLGALYACVTVYLGMKALEHEYKVMGLAPYASVKNANIAYNKFSSILQLNKESLNFKHKYTPNLMDLVMIKEFYRIRFDAIAAGIQKLTEDLLTNWIREAIKKYKINTIACGGGVFMNVKANMLISQLPEVKHMFVMPSCGDESNAIGAVYWGYKELTGKTPSPLKDLYLGPQYSDAEIGATLRRLKIRQKYQVTSPKHLSRSIADVISKGKVVAIFHDRLEFGARALGNRSILADASRWEVVEMINKMVKSRDFWMPFAPVILDTWANRYLVNPKKISTPYMIMAFPSTTLAQQHLKAAMHPYDKTLRPQVIQENWNPFYYQILKDYEAITGMGGCLNTSFNIHGEPIVCTPEDAISTFERSGLKYLAMEKYLIQKK